MKYTKNNKKKNKNNKKSKKLFKGGVFDIPYHDGDDLAKQIFDQQIGVFPYKHDDSQGEIVERLRSFKPNIQKLNTLEQYVNKLKTETVCKIPKTSCETFSSGASGQIVKKCGNSIYKGPNENLILNIETSRNGYSYLLDPNTMNILVQSVIKYLIEMKLINNVEHYEEICSGNIDNGITVSYYLKGKSYEYCPKEDVDIDNSDTESVGTVDTYMTEPEELSGGTAKKCYNSLESYLVENEKINVKWVADWLQQIFDILDQLFDLIQFHHCDPKAAQIFLNTNERNEVVAILGDLDKVTFSLGVGNNAFRMRLRTSTLYSIAAHRPEFTNFSTAMRYQDSAIESNTYEKLAFLYSSCLLCNNLEQAKELKKIVLEKNPRFTDDFSVAEITDQIWRKKEIPPIKGIKNRMTGLFITPQGKGRKFNLGYPLQFISVDKALKYIPINSQVNLNEELKLELVKGKKSSGGKKTKNKKERRKKKNTKKRKYKKNYSMKGGPPLQEENHDRWNDQLNNWKNKAKENNKNLM